MNFKVKTASSSSEEIAKLFELDPSYNGWTSDGFYFFENSKLWSSNFEYSFITSPLPEIKASEIEKVVNEYLDHQIKKLIDNRLVFEEIPDIKEILGDLGTQVRYDHTCAVYAIGEKPQIDDEFRRKFSYLSGAWATWKYMHDSGYIKEEAQR